MSSKKNVKNVKNVKNKNRIKSRRNGKKNKSKCGCGYSLLNWGGDGPEDGKNVNQTQIITKNEEEYKNNNTQSANKQTDGFERWLEVNKQLKPPDFFKIRNQSDINNFKDIKYSSNNILGGDNGDSDNNITGKIANIATNTANAVTNAVTNANKQTADTVSDLSTHTYSVLNDTTAHVKSVADQVYDGVSNFFNKSWDNTTDTLYKIGDSAKYTLHKATTKNGSVTSGPFHQEQYTQPNTPHDTPRSTSNESNGSKYISEAIKQHKQTNEKNKTGGRRKRHTKRINSKKRSSRKSKKSKKSKTTKKQRKYILKGGCTDCGGLKSPDYSTLANNAQPISGIRTAEPHGIYGQRPYPVWQYSK